MIKTLIPQLCQAQQRLIRRVLAGRLVSAADVAGLAEEVVAQGVAPALRGLRRQGRPTALGARGESGGTYFEGPRDTLHPILPAKPNSNKLP